MAASLLLAAGATLVVAALLLRRRAVPVARRIVALVASLVATVSALLTIATRPLVEWDQLALHSITLGTTLSGYRFAAFRDEVKFVLVRGAEVSQGRYATVLVVHLAAPIIGTLALVLAGAAITRAPRPAPSGGDRGVR